MRVRKMDKRYPSWVDVVETNGTTQRYTYPSVEGFSYLGEFKSITDDPHPGYKLLRKRDVTVLGDLDLYTCKRSYTSGSLTSVVPASQNGGRQYTLELSGDFAAYAEASRVVSPKLTNIQLMRERALNHAYAKISGDAVMSGEILADITKTFASLRHPFQSARTHLAKAFKSASKHYGKTARSIASANASAWLEYRYGLKPLMLDINQAIANAAQFSQHVHVRRRCSRASQRDRIRSEYSFAEGAVSSVLMTSTQVVYKETADVSAGVLFKVMPLTAVDQVLSDYMANANSVPSTVWEIIPYSFVVDWFANIGDCLAARFLPPGVVIVGNWTTCVYKADIDYINGPAKKYGWQAVPPTAVGTFGNSSRHTERVTRICNQPPTLTPSLNFDISSLTHAVDAAALTWQRVIPLLNSLSH